MFDGVVRLHWLWKELSSCLSERLFRLQRAPALLYFYRHLASPAFRVSHSNRCAVVGRLFKLQLFWGHLGTSQTVAGKGMVWRGRWFNCWWLGERRHRAVMWHAPWLQVPGMSWRALWPNRPLGAPPMALAAVSGFISCTGLLPGHLCQFLPWQNQPMERTSSKSAPRQLGPGRDCREAKQPSHRDRRGRGANPGNST